MGGASRASLLVIGWRVATATVVLAVAVSLIAELFGHGQSAVAEVAVVRSRPDLDPRIKTFERFRAEDIGKPGSVRGVMAWRFFEIPAGSSGPSPSQLRFRFDAPVEILQISVSVDVADPRANLVEFAAAINSRDGYGLDRRADWLMHASWVRRPRAPSALDETTRLPKGVQLRPSDFLGISGWLGGDGVGDPIRVSPEVVVLYRWLGGPLRSSRQQHAWRTGPN